MHKKLKNIDNYNMPFEVTASVGFVSHEANSSLAIDDIIKEADKKMYEDKVKNHHTRENVITEIKKNMGTTDALSGI